MVQQVSRRETELFSPLADLAVAYAWVGHDKEAKEAAAQLQKVYPGFTVQTWAGLHCSEDPTFKAQYQLKVEGLRKAGCRRARRRRIELAALSANQRMSRLA